MTTSRLQQWISIGACVLALAACKSGDDDDGDDDGMTGSGGAGSGGSAAGSGGTGSGGSGSGGAIAMGSGGKGAAGTGSGGTGSGGTGSGGTGSGGTGSGGTGSGGAGAIDAGTDAGAETMAVATIAGFSGGTVTGTATFMQTGTDVTVVVDLMNCADGMHPVHIHEGVSCADATAQGAHWGMTRGEGIPSVMCTGGKGTAMLTRTAAMPALAWTIGGATATNLVGHAFVVHNNDDAKTRIGCGVITQD